MNSLDAHHFVLQCSFKFQAPLTRTPPVNDDHSVAQRGQRVEPKVFHPFEGVVHQLYLNVQILYYILIKFKVT